MSVSLESSISTEGEDSSRSVPTVQMDLIERGLAIRTPVSLRRRSRPDVDCNYAENFSMMLWSWSHEVEVKLEVFADFALDTLAS